MQFSQRPIPDLSQIRGRRGARQHPIDLESIEDTEPSVNILLHGVAGENYYYSENNPPYMHRAPGAMPELYVREGVLARLLLVNKKLSPLGIELFVFDAYRPAEVQTYFHDVWVPKYLHQVHPDWSVEEVAREVNNYWAPGFPHKRDINPLSPPPHATGGVVDLSLRQCDTHELLFMGADFDVVAPISFADHFEREAGLRALTNAEILAMGNRRILHHVMVEAGFVAHPNEWWHFGYGDQLSAFNSGAPHAVYSIMWLPGEAR